MQTDEERTYTKNGSDVIEAELDAIGRDQQHKLIGLALSGGGVRSASFSLGALQALANEERLSWIHYMSTVSGGGFIGSSLTWFLEATARSGNKAFSAERQKFPIGTKRRALLQPYGEVRPDQEIPTVEDRRRSEDAVKILDHIRFHANYLSPGGGQEFISAIAMVLKSLLPSLLTYFAMIALPLAFLVFLVAPPTGPGLFSDLLDLTVPIAALKAPNPWLTLALAAAATFMLASYYYSWKTFTRSRPRQGASKNGTGDADALDRQYEARYNAQQFGGKLLLATIVLAILGTLPAVHGMVADWYGAAGLTTAGIVTALARLFIQLYRIHLSQGQLSRFLVTFSAMALSYGLLLSAYGVCVLLSEISIPSLHSPWNVLALIALPIGLGWFTGWFTNLNFVGLHRFYRDRLMETFLPDMDVVRETGLGGDQGHGGRHWKKAADANQKFFADMCSWKDEPTGERIRRGPYHIINTNVVLTDSLTPRHRDRGGANFILSPLYCGSDATGWRRTRDWTMRDGSITLATAMAISGAAVNPRTGPEGKGPTRTFFVSLLMSLTNVRLGFWAKNPAAKDQDAHDDVPSRRSPPNFVSPGLMKGLVGRGYREGEALIELTDGGHFDNTGLYELIRRKVKLIIMVDGSADKDFNYQSLATAFQRIRADFGTLIRFEEPDHDLDDLLPNTGKESPFREKFGLAKRGYAMARIDYRPSEAIEGEEDGTLILIKSTMIDGLPADILGYKSANKDFPDETTMDQFFGENQFEAYRELGYQITKAALQDQKIKTVFNRLRPWPQRSTTPRSETLPVSA